MEPLEAIDIQKVLGTYSSLRSSHLALESSVSRKRYLPVAQPVAILELASYIMLSGELAL